MKRLVKFMGLPTRVLFCSLLALACQVFLVVRHPDLLLVVQEWVKQGSVSTFEGVYMAPGYRVAYNLLNGDGILVHTLFVILALLAYQLAASPFRLLTPSR
ncbi:MAG: hypothetical protein OXN16_01685 [Gammaproteobacteria bacterium]|nr:hypothetical protein [Gammaproteobacteria bacterium]